MNLQQTPNPEAQLPSAIPPRLVHSSIVKQLPLIVVSDKTTHCRFGNVTTVNKEKDFGLLGEVMLRDDDDGAAPDGAKYPNNKIRHLRASIDLAIWQSRYSLLGGLFAHIGYS